MKILYGFGLREDTGALARFKAIHVIFLKTRMSEKINI